MKVSQNFIKLSDLTQIIRNNVFETFNGCEYLVLAETSDIKNYPDRGYCFLTLSERVANRIVAKMDAVIWARDYGTILRFEETTGIAFAKNLELLMRVQIDFHAVYGMKLTVTEIDPAYTLGKMEMARQQVLLKLLNENPGLIFLKDGELFSSNKNCRIPSVIKKIALISAPDSDGQRDFIHELENNQFNYQFTVDFFPVIIQGNMAQNQLRNAIEMASEEVYDLVVIARGGGSSHDLSAFDEYDVVCSIAACPNPILCGIGHERNKSLSDLIACMSVKTPTKAASFIIQYNREEEDSLESYFEKTCTIIQTRLEQEKHKIHTLSSRLSLQAKLALIKEQNRLNTIEQKLLFANPIKVLEKGYAIIKSKKGIVSKASNLRSNEEIIIQFADGEITAKTS